MAKGIRYDDINLPDKVSYILEHDFWIQEHVSPLMVRTVLNPVKFSASTCILIHKGDCAVEINLRTYRFKGPAMVNIDIDDIVLPKNISDDFDASFIVFSKRLTGAISSTIKDFSVLSMMSKHPVVSIDPADISTVENFFSTLKRISSDKTNKYPFETILFSMVAFVFQNSSKFYETFHANVPENVHNRIADRFLRLVQDNFKRERFLDFYANQLDITPKHLSRTVLTQTGTSAVEWITRHVILEAKVMLRSSNLNIQQIAEELNFPSQSFFGKYFKKATGLSPKDFRNSL